AEQVAGELVVGVDRGAAHDVGPGNAPEQGRYEAADADHPLPAGPPALTLAFAPKLEADVTHDQGGEDQEERQVEAREEGGVPLGEGGEGGAARDDQPDLVAVPDRPDGVQDGAALVAVAAQRPHQHADPEIEALEDEVADPE